MTNIYYFPGQAAVGDVMPFYSDGEFKLFYLHHWRIPVEQGHDCGWYLLGTRDFVHYKEYGPCKIPGGAGSVLATDVGYHLFFCLFPEGRQIVCHATSDDLLHWQHHTEQDFSPDERFYAVTDWRDPHVFWNEVAGEYWMLLAARTRAPHKRGGCVGLCASHDLVTWEARPPLYAPNLYLCAPECPDIFQIGEWWYLVYSTYTDRFATHYRMGASPSGPWLTPAEDTFDGRAFYAAKTGSDGARRFLFGWNPTRNQNIYNWNPPGYTGCDFNTWDWGGHLIVHEIYQAQDGTLKVRLPEKVTGKFRQAQCVSLNPEVGKWEQAEGRWLGHSPSGFAFANGGALPRQCYISANIRFVSGTRRLGLLLRASESLDKAYNLQIEPDRQRVIFKPVVFDNEHGGKIPPAEIQHERPLACAPDKGISLKMVLDDTVAVFYLADQVAMSTRMYDLAEGNWGFYVVDGEATIENITLRTM